MTGPDGKPVNAPMLNDMSEEEESQKPYLNELIMRPLLDFDPNEDYLQSLKNKLQQSNQLLSSPLERIDQIPGLSDDKDSLLHTQKTQIQM